MTFLSRHFCHFLIHASRTRLRFEVAVNGMRAIHPGDIVLERRGATVNSGWIPSNLKLSGL